MTELVVQVDERPTAWLLGLSAVQWFFFMLASVITVPVVLGPVFGLSAAQTAAFTERAIFVSGVIGLLQAWVGHRLPVIEGPAGMWWGVWLVLADMNRQTGGHMVTLLQELSAGMAVAGAAYIAIAVFNWTGWIQKWFTPVVSGTFMLLLSLQLSRSLVSGMLGIESSPARVVEWPVALVSLGLVVLTVWLTYRGRGAVQSFAVLISLLAGWLAYATLGWLSRPAASGETGLVVPTWLPYGAPRWHTGVVLTCLFTAVILLTNFMTSVRAMEQAAQVELSPSAYRRGMLVSGIGAWLCGVFTTVGCVPLATSASLVSLTRIAARAPFLVASAGLAVLGLLPWPARWLATLPEPVGYAVLFTVFGQLLGFGLRDLRRLALTQRDLFVISLSLLPGVGTFFVPASAWSNFPQVVGFLLDNGLIVGIALVMILEHGVFRAKAS